jgi:HSP20 family protein
VPAWSPSLDLSESEKEITVRAEIPGVDPENIDIAVSGNVLTISGEKKEEYEERSQSVFRAERRFGSFRRSVALPDFVDTEHVSADYDKGVLTIHLAKSEKDVARRIPVAKKK